MIYQSLYNPKTFQTPFQSCVWAMESMVLHKFPGVEFVVDDRRFLICCVNRLQAWRSLRHHENELELCVLVSGLVCRF